MAYIGRVPFDSLNAANLDAIAHENAEAVLNRIEALLSEVYNADPPLQFAGSLQEVGDAVEEFIADRHPEISPEARSAVANRFTFDWK